MTEKRPTAYPHEGTHRATVKVTPYITAHGRCVKHGGKNGKRWAIVDTGAARVKGEIIERMRK